MMFRGSYTMPGIKWCQMHQGNVPSLWAQFYFLKVQGEKLSHKCARPQMILSYSDLHAKEEHLWEADF